MKARSVIAVTAAMLIIALSSYPQQNKAAQDDAKLLARAKAIHESAITLDTHVDISGAQYATEKLDPGKETPLKCDLVKMKQGGLDGVFLAVFVGQQNDFTDAGYKRALDQAMVKFEAVHRLTEKLHPELCQLATSPDQVPQIVKTGKRAIMIGVENGYPIGKDLSMVKKFYDLGARYITLSHSGHNQICDSSAPGTPPINNGLSDFGKQVVAEMNRLGSGVFLFNAEYGYLVERGETTKMVRDVSLSGEILKTLHNIGLAGKDRKMHQGFCGKGGQTVPVGDGSPHILLYDAVVGGSGSD